MSRLFISHARRDVAVARALADELDALGHAAFLDEQLDSGPGWWDDLVAQIESSDAFVPLLSRAYVDSEACRLEARRAVRAAVTIRPVDLGRISPEECEPGVAAAIWLRYDDADPERLTGLAQQLVAGLSPTPLTVAAPGPEGHAAEAPAGLLPPGVAPPVATAALPLAALVVGAMVIAVLVAWFISHRSDHPGDSAPATSQAADIRPGPLIQAIDKATANARGNPLPASSCRANGNDRVTCAHPTAHIAKVTFRAFDTTAQLYAAYVNAAERVSGAPFQANVQDCAQTHPDGEVSWNRSRRHSRDFTLEQAAAGGLDPQTEAAGRVFCVTSGQVMTMVWTQDPGLLGVVTGQPTERVVNWWTEVHRLFD